MNKCFDRISVLFFTVATDYYYGSLRLIALTVKPETLKPIYLVNKLYSLMHCLIICLKFIV